MTDPTSGRRADDPGMAERAQLCGALDAAGRSCALPVPHDGIHWAQAGIWGAPCPQEGIEPEASETLPDAPPDPLPVPVAIFMGVGVAAATLATLVLARLRP